MCREQRRQFQASTVIQKMRDEFSLAIESCACAESGVYAPGCLRLRVVLRTKVLARRHFLPPKFVGP
jgi:hypothetical protein